MFQGHYIPLTRRLKNYDAIVPERLLPTWHAIPQTVYVYSSAPWQLHLALHVGWSQAKSQSQTREDTASSTSAVVRK